MEEANRDSQDSESSSTSSWILIGNEETVDDIPEGNRSHLIFKETIPNVAEIDLKNNLSDIESDGISVISESEFLNGRSEDDATVSSDGEKWDVKDNLQSPDDDETAKEVLERNDYFLATETIENSVINDQEIFQSAEEEVTDVSNVSNELSLIPAENTPQEISLVNCLCNIAQKYNVNRLLTWPSLLGTSIVILAVFIYPFYSLDLNNEQCDIEHDVQMLPDDKIDNLDPHLYCEQIRKKDGAYRDFNFEKCMTTIEKRKRKIAKAKMYFDKNDENLYETEKIDRRHHKFIRKHRPVAEDNVGHENLHQNDMKETSSDELFDMENDGCRHVQDKMKLLMEKEKSLKDWENKLIEREKKIQKNEYNPNPNMENFSGRKSKKDMKHKGDFDDQYSFRPRIKKNKIEAENNSNKSGKLVKNFDKQERKNFEKKKKNHHLKEMFNKYKRKGDTEYSQNFVKNRDMNRKAQMKNGAEFKLKLQNLRKKNQTRLLDDDNVTLTGEWYLNLNEGRRDIRKKEEKALWWFERAEFRRNKRNKAYWYFQYMFNRENLRTRPKNI